MNPIGHMKIMTDYGGLFEILNGTFSKDLATDKVIVSIK
jgi:hypothetical protein